LSHGPITSSDLTRPCGNHRILCKFAGPNWVSCYLKLISQPKECVHAILLGPMKDTLRASPTVLSMWLQIVRFTVEKSKCASLAQEIGCSAPNLCSLPRLVNGATLLFTTEKECNELYLTAAQYFWLVDHNDWSRWFAISSAPCICSSSFSVIGGVAKNKQLWT
jgi:hypothetical protein